MSQQPLLFLSARPTRPEPVSRAEHAEPVSRPTRAERPGPSRRASRSGPSREAARGELVLSFCGVESAPVGLSGRERQVFALLGQGLGRREIAARLEVAVNSIDTYMHRAKKKLGARTTKELCYLAIVWRFTSPA